MIGKPPYLFDRLWLPCIICLIAACQSQVNKPHDLISNKFSDPVLVKIYDFQDRRDTEALMDYLDHKNALYRKTAALAFASVQDTSALPLLAHLLNDNSAKVRKAAAYAIGQSYDSSMVSYLAEALQYEDSVFVRKELLEALGKVITQPQIALLYNQSIPSVKEKEGMAWGLYRAGLRNVHDGVCVALAVSFLAPDNSYSTRLAAAHFLARTESIDVTDYAAEIIRSATQDRAVNVRMAAVLALRKIPTENALQTLTTLALKDHDYRIRINGLRALTTFDFHEVAPAAFTALNDENINVAIAAADVIDALATPKATQTIVEEASTHKNYRVKASLLGTALKVATAKDNLINQIREEYTNSNNPYFKAGLLTALGKALQAYEFLIEETFSAQHPAITTAGMKALTNIRRQKNFPEAYKAVFSDVFKRAIQSGDIALIAIVSELLSDPALPLRDAYTDAQFLYAAKNKLSLPKDNEALQALKKAIAWFEGKTKIQETKYAYNHPIDWDLVRSVRKDQEVMVKTEKGDIALRLLVEEAPGSVANFISLANSGYYHGKNFHRVVPNFVIQGGCNRGDGYGGENYSIRSEFPNIRYQTGAVGMASAGKDTEGTQWFITHSPTPHLDGRYTIFAQVTDGMDVVHRIEVGDKILAVELVPYSGL